MAPLPWLASGVDRSASQRPFSPRSDDRPAPRSPDTRDVNLARRAGVSLFVIGADDAVTDLFTPLWPGLVTPIVVRYRGEPLRLPPASTPVGTIVIYDLNTLTHLEQLELNHWVQDARGHAWVVSTAWESLLPRVQAGTFHAGLYYHLNVVTIDLTSQ